MHQHVEDNERQSPPRRGKRLLGCVTVGLCVFGAAAAYSVTHATAKDSFGPHEATYSLNTSGQIVVDFGPLGTAEHSTEGLLPTAIDIFHPGATVRVGQIPSDAPIGTGTTGAIDALSTDLQSYVQFFSHPEVTIHNVTDELLRDTLEHTMLYGSEMSAGLMAAYLALGSRRRQEMIEIIKKNRRKEITAIGLAGLVLSGCMSSDSANYTTTQLPDSPIFADTVLAGTHITGRLGEIIDTDGSQVIKYMKAENAYYGDVAHNVATALKNYNVPSGNPEDYVTLFVASDLHCNTGMANAIHTAVAKTGANIYIDSGDTVMSGTAIEKYCVDTFSAAIPDKVKKVVAPGNHDSSTTIQQEKDDGFTILEGKVVTIDNLAILGDRDNYFNAIGQPVKHINNETVAQEGQRLAKIACDQPKPVDLLVVHRSEAAFPALSDGCANTGFSGHRHVVNGPDILTNGSIDYTSGTTGGASEDKLTIGTELEKEANMSVWLVDKNTKKATYMRTITIHTNGSVEVSAWENLHPDTLIKK